jgi:hypothetical protein
MHNHAQIQIFFQDFCERNPSQIRSKSRLFRIEEDEIKSSLFILISERLDEFDSMKGRAEAFFFGILHARLVANASDICCRASTIDDDSEAGVAFKNNVEYWTATQNNEICFTNTNGIRIAAGISDLISLADAASGKSATQIASEMRITRRRVNQILKRKRDAAASQCGFDF